MLWVAIVGFITEDVLVLLRAAVSSLWYVTAMTAGGVFFSFVLLTIYCHSFFHLSEVIIYQAVYS